MAKNIYFIINYPRDFEENEKDIYLEKKILSLNAFLLNVIMIIKNIIIKKFYVRI